MVSKLLKRTQTKSPKPSPKSLSRRFAGTSRRKSPRSSPLKNLSAASSAAIRSCRRRLFRAFSRLAVLSTPVKLRQYGFHRLRQAPESSPALTTDTVSRPLPPPAIQETKTIFLDLDETLVHSQTDPPPKHYDFIVRPVINGTIIPFYVIRRPGVDEFLKELSARSEVVVFTAGLKEYASLVLDRLDPTGRLISHRLFRDSCTEIDGVFVKDLSEIGRDLGRAVIIDDNPNAYMRHKANAVPVIPFVDDLNDKELYRVIKFFDIAVRYEDMRDAIAYYLSETREQKNND